MPIDPVADAAEIQALQDAAREEVRRETASTLATLAKGKTDAEALLTAATTEIASTKAAATQAAADLAAAKAAGESTAAELLTLKTAAETAAKAADKAIVDALPEALRSLVAGKTGAELKAAADTLSALANKQVPGRSNGDGGPSVEATEEHREWAKSKGYAFANDAKLVESYNKIGPGKPKLKLVG